MSSIFDLTNAQYRPFVNVAGVEIPPFGVGTIQSATSSASYEDYTLRVGPGQNSEDPIAVNGPAAVSYSAGALKTGDCLESPVMFLAAIDESVPGQGITRYAPNTSMLMEPLATGRFLLIATITKNNAQYGLFFDSPSIAQIAIVQAPTGGIPPRSGFTPGSATCSIVEYQNGQLTVTTTSITVLNWSKTTIAPDGDRFAIAAKHTGDVWWAEAFDCADTSGTGGGGGTSGSGGGGGPSFISAFTPSSVDLAPTVNAPFSWAPATSGGKPPYTFQLSNGSLPAGLALSSNGQITGTPTNSIGTTAYLTATDARNNSSTTKLTFTPVVDPVRVYPPTNLSLTVGVPYSDYVTSTGGESVTYSVDTLPAGLSLNAITGEISGTPTSSGTVTSTFTATSIDGSSRTTDSVSFTIVV